MSEQDYKTKALYKQGVEFFTEKNGAERLPALDSLYAFSPELADVVVAHGLADIWVNKTKRISVREKEIAVLSSLITAGTTPAEIKTHTQCLLNVGVSKEEIKEFLILLTLYIGVPKVMAATKIIDEVFAENKD